MQKKKNPNGFKVHLKKQIALLNLIEWEPELLQTVKKKK